MFHVFAIPMLNDLLKQTNFNNSVLNLLLWKSAVSPTPLYKPTRDTGSYHSSPNRIKEIEQDSDHKYRLVLCKGRLYGKYIRAEFPSGLFLV